MSLFEHFFKVLSLYLEVRIRDLDPHQCVKQDSDPYPHQGDKQEQDPDPHQSDKQNQDPDLDTHQRDEDRQH